MSDLGYVSVQVPQEHGMLIEDWLIHDCHMDESQVYSPDKMHCTLMYDKRNPIKRGSVKADPRVHKAMVTGADIFGIDGRVIVLTLHCPSLNKRNDQLLEMGMQSDYDQYRPHISVLSDATDDDLATVARSLPTLMPLTIPLEGETWSTVDEDWSAHDD